MANWFATSEERKLFERLGTATAAAAPREREVGAACASRVFLWGAGGCAAGLVAGAALARSRGASIFSGSMAYAAGAVGLAVAGGVHARNAAVQVCCGELLAVNEPDALLAAYARGVARESPTLRERYAKELRAAEAMDSRPRSFVLDEFGGVASDRAGERAITWPMESQGHWDGTGSAAVPATRTVPAAGYKGSS